MTMSSDDSGSAVAPGLDPASSPNSDGTWLYTFDCRRANGSPVCLEAKELRSDARAIAWAGRLLTEHLTCASIEVFEAERRVAVVVRGSD